MGRRNFARPTRTAVPQHADLPCGRYIVRRRAAPPSEICQTQCCVPQPVSQQTRHTRCRALSRHHPLACAVHAPAGLRADTAPWSGQAGPLRGREGRAQADQPCFCNLPTWLPRPGLHSWSGAWHSQPARPSPSLTRIPTLSSHMRLSTSCGSAGRALASALPRRTRPRTQHLHAALCQKWLGERRLGRRVLACAAARAHGRLLVEAAGGQARQQARGAPRACAPPARIGYRARVG